MFCKNEITKIFCQVDDFCKEFSDKMWADKGHLSRALWDMLFEEGIQLFTKLKKNMKGRIMEHHDKIFLRKEPLLKQ